MTGTSRNSKLLNAPKEQVYKAFLDQEALEFWLAPDEMTGKIHDFSPKAGGGYTMSLFYADKQLPGKTSGNEDRFVSKFTEIVPNEKIVQSIRFQSDQEAFGGEMTMKVYLEEKAPERTLVTVIFENIPAGVAPEDNETGTAQSLEKLARYLADRALNSN